MSHKFKKKYRSQFTKTHHFKRKIHFFLGEGLRSPDRFPAGPHHRPKPSLLDLSVRPPEFQSDPRLCYRLPYLVASHKIHFTGRPKSILTISVLLVISCLTRFYINSNLSADRVRTLNTACTGFLSTEDFSSNPAEFPHKRIPELPQCLFS